MEEITEDRFQFSITLLNYSWNPDVKLYFSLIMLHFNKEPYALFEFEINKNNRIVIGLLFSYLLYIFNDKDT